MRKLSFFICLVLAVAASVAVAVDYIVVDDFDSYADTAALKGVWKDKMIIPGHGSAVLNTDANFAVDGNSMRFYYWNIVYPSPWYYSETRRTYSSGQDWSYAGAGVTELEIDWFGDVDNGPDPPMYVKLSDGSITVQVNPGPSGYGPNDVTDESQHTWHIPLSDFNDGGVTLSNITAITLGIGDNVYEGGDEYGTLYFDDIRLYPPRCFPEYGPAGDFTDDCRVDGNDLRTIVAEWCRAGYWGPPVPVVEYLFEEGSGTTVANTGTFGSAYDLTIGMSWDGNGDPVMEPNNDPCWFNDSDPCRGWTLWFDGELGLHPNYPDANGGDYLIIPPLNLDSNAVTIAAWLKPDPWADADGKGTPGQKGAFTGLVHNRRGPGDTAAGHETAAGMSYGGDSGFVYDGMFGYVWNDNASATWDWDSDIIIPDYVWRMAAVVVEPTQATLYLVDTNGTSDPCDDSLLKATNQIAHLAEEFDWRTVIAGDAGGDADRFFRGQMDAVRVYGFSLSQAQVKDVSRDIQENMYYPLVSQADLCVGRKDPCDPCGIINDQIDLCDWSKFADEWLETKLWPEP